MPDESGKIKIGYFNWGKNLEEENAISMSPLESFKRRLRDYQYGEAKNDYRKIYKKHTSNIQFDDIDD